MLAPLLATHTHGLINQHAKRRMPDGAIAILNGNGPSLFPAVREDHVPTGEGPSKRRQPLVLVRERPASLALDAEARAPRQNSGYQTLEPCDRSAYRAKLSFFSSIGK